MTLKVSVSSLDTYEGCPRKYKFQQIDKLPRKTWEHLDVGNYVHEVLEHFHKQLNADASQQPEELLKQLAKNTWNKFSTKISAEGMEKSKGLLKSYLAYVSSEGWPDVLATEDRFSIEINKDLVIRGVVDRIDRTPTGYRILDYKGLALDTPIPTPTGWTTMGDLKVGDKVFGSDGRPTNVIIKSQVHNRPCYKLTFSDGSEVVCDNVHLWQAAVTGASVSDNREKTFNADQLFEIFNFLQKDQVGSIVIKNPKPIQYPEQDLPVDPWALGAFLGAAHSGVVPNADDSNQKAALESLLKENGFLDSACIPDLYLNSSVAQRLELLRGLMDAAGDFSEQAACCEFTSVDKEFADGARQLMRSMGISTQLHSGVDEDGRASHVIAFYLSDFNPFRLKSKADKARPHLLDFAKVESLRSISSIEKVDSVPTQCIQVDAPDSLYVCGSGFNVTHNTGKSKNLDKFQLQVYGMHLKNLFPDIQEYDGVYLVLPEGPKEVSYTFTLGDIEEAKEDVIKTAESIATDKTWEPKPTFLCNYCDYYDACPDAWGKGKSGGSDLVKISGRKKF